MDTSETSRGLLDVDLVSASHLQTLLPADLLSQHIVHGNLTDIISSQAQDYATHHRLEGQYLSDQYESSDLLSHTDLTEEESKLAAAIVAAQLEQQQKQQCIQEGVIVNAKNEVVTTLPQLTHPGHSSVIESLNNSHGIPSNTMDEYDAQDLMENDLVDAKLFSTITNHIRLPSLKKFPHNLRNIPLSRYNLITNHELSDPHTISSIITSNGVVQNTNIHNNIRTNYTNEVSENSMDLQEKLLMHNSSLDLTLQANGLNTRLNDGISNSLNGNQTNGLNSNIMNTAESNILTNSSHEHIHILNAGTLVNENGKLKKTQIHLNGNTITTNLNGTIIKEELDFDIKNIKCDEEDAQAINEHLNAINNSQYTVSDSDCSDVPTKRTRTSNNNTNGTNSTNATNSSRSLPHKKRISRRLKSNNLKKSNNVSNNVNPGVNNNITNGGIAIRSAKKPTLRNSYVFTCQLCSDKFETQLHFYEHLKFHYEPQEERQMMNKFTTQETQYMEIGDMVTHQDLDSPLLRATLSEPHTILPNLDEDSMAADNLSTVQDSCNSINSLSSTNETHRQSNEHDIHLDSLPNLVINNSLRCKYCSMSFKRHSSLEGHVRDVHFKEEDLQDEFSEPEDLMEGIRSVVEASGGHCSEDDVEDIKINLIEPDKNQRDWYPADELRATEVDLQEIEAEQNNQRENNIRENNIHDNEFVSNNEPVTNTTNTNTTINSNNSNNGNNEQTIETNAPFSFICALCGDTFDSREQYNDHEPDCQLLMYDSESEIADDKNGAKPSGPKLSCLQCDRHFIHRNSLMYHIQSHSEQRPYQCEVCGNSFFATSALKVHMRRHSGDKPYQCVICAKNFRQWSDLKYHMVSIHSDVRQYQCEFCGKDFARKYSLIVHRRIHTGEKNYKCEFCDKTFRASSYLQNHRRIHTGEKPYPCEICGKPFRVRGDMKRHMITHARDRNVTNGKLPVIASAATTTRKTKTKNGKTEIGKPGKTEIASTNGLPKLPDVTITHKLLQQFASDDSNASSAKLQIPKLECVGSSSNSNYDHQDVHKSLEMQAQTILTDESLGSPAQPMNLNITNSKSTNSNSNGIHSNKECSLELQVQVTSDQNADLNEIAVVTSAEQTNINRFSRNLESSESLKDGSTVYLWPVYMT